jgi:CubicO group peptidase (beta-lactamase class C family)
MRRVFTATTVVALSLHLCVATAAYGGPPAQRAARAKAAAGRPDILRAFERFTRARMELDRTTGLTIGFIQGDAVWVRAYGYADLENKTPATPESAYRLASVTKPMTAVAILQLAEQGKIDLDAEVQTYVPYFPKKQWPVTVRQVLGHLGGISHYRAPAENRIKERKTTREAIAIFEGFDLVAEPGTRYSYSSYGYNLLGAIVEAASGKPYGEYIREKVWGPLRMTDTRMDDPAEIVPNRVRGYRLVDGELKNSEFVDISSRFAAGGTRSTVPDLLKFGRGFMSGKLLSPEMRDLMCTSMATRDGRLTDYGLGWGTDPVGGRFAVSHSGGQQETRTLLYIFPSRDLAIAAATNFEGSGVGAYVARLFELVTGEPWGLRAYTGDKVSDALVRGLDEAFAHGFAYYDQYGRELAKGPGEAAEAFAYFNRAVSRAALEANPEQAGKALGDGRHPAAGQAFVKVGSAMAAILARKLGAERLRAYSSLGAIAFFHDYVEAYQKDPAVAQALRFDPTLEALVSEWHASWSKANTAYVRGLSGGPDVDWDVAGRRLKATFAGASVYPDLSEPLLGMARQYLVRGERERATRAARLAAELYPNADGPAAMLGVILAISGAREQARAQIGRALALNPRGLASASGLNGVAYQLAGFGKTDQSLELLKLAVELHPKDANLYDSMGELYLAKGQKDLSAQWYRKALEVDPKLQTAIEALKRIEGGQ